MAKAQIEAYSLPECPIERKKITVSTAYVVHYNSAEGGFGIRPNKHDSLYWLVMCENVHYLSGCTTLQEVMSLLQMRSLFGSDNLLNDEVLAPLESIQELRETLKPTNPLAALEKDIVLNV